MKYKKTLLALGAITSTIVPVIAAVSCSMAETYVQQTTGFTDSIKKVLNKDLDFVGGFNDLRAFLDNVEQYKQVGVVGVEKKRVSNDGLQVDYKMNSGDQHALQVLFQIMVQDPNITATFNGQTQQVFRMYSHSGYKPLTKNDQVDFMNGARPVSANPYAKNGNLPKSLPTGNVFAKADQEIPQGSIDFKNIYKEFAKKGSSKINIAMIPSKGPAALTAVVKKLNQFSIDHNLPLFFTPTTDYNSAATSLGTTYQGAYLPVGTWGKLASSKSNFILQASRPSAIATLDLSADKNELIEYPGDFTDEIKVAERIDKFGSLYLKDIPSDGILSEEWINQPKKMVEKEWRKALKIALDDANNPLHEFALATINTRKSRQLNDTIYLTGKYEALLYARRDSKFTKKLMDAKAKQGKDFWISLSSFGKFTYGRTSPTSPASSIYPELWFNDHIYVSNHHDFSFKRL